MMDALTSPEYVVACILEPNSIERVRSSLLPLSVRIDNQPDANARLHIGIIAPDKNYSSMFKDFKSLSPQMTQRAR